MRPVLWIINQYVSLPPSPGGVRHLSLARELNQLGWDVSLICAPQSVEAAGPRIGNLPPRRVVDLDGIHVLALDVPGYKGNGPRRVANMSAFGAAAALPSATNELPRANMVIGSSVHPLAAAAGMRQAQRLGVPFVFEIRDLWPETFVRLGRMRQSSVTAKALYALEARLWSRASMILSPLGQVPDYESLRRLPHRPFLHIPNGVDTSAFDPTPMPHDGPLRLGYFGSHGNTDYLDVIVRALAEPDMASRTDEISVHFFGWGPRKEALHCLARELGVKNLSFHDPLDRSSIPSVMQSMDAFLFPLGDSRGLYRFGASPNKLQDYMAAGRPVLMNAPFARDPVSVSGGGGILVTECTSAAWAAALGRFLDTTRDERTAMGRRLRRLAEAEYDFKVLGENLALGLQPLMGVTT